MIKRPPLRALEKAGARGVTVVSVLDCVINGVERTAKSTLFPQVPVPKLLI